MVAAEEEEWMPEGEGEGEESDGVEDEGVFEGRNVVASLGNQISEDAMDTIARTANHPYYLRSLHQPEAYPGPVAPTAAVSVPRRLPAQRRQSQLPAPSYDIPTPILPPPPPPKGDTAGDYYEALHARDLEIRKGQIQLIKTSPHNETLIIMANAGTENVSRSANCLCFVWGE